MPAWVSQCCGQDRLVVVTPVPASASVRIGGYSLEVGAYAGSFAQFEPEQETENAPELKAALAEEPKERPKAVAGLVEFEETAAAVTDRIEHANKLLRAAAAGQLLELRNLTGEINGLLDLFGRLDKAGRFEEELALIRSLNGLLVLSLRWLDLVRSLLSLLQSARAAGHEVGQAWAHHELGSLHLCTGESEQASQHLREALRIEEQLGDLAGRCVTRHNLDSARRDLALPGSGGGRPPRRLLRLAGLATALVVFGGGATGIALALRGGGHPHTTQPGTHTVTVQLAGEGTGSVKGGGIACPKDCTTAIDHGSTLTLTANAAAGSLFGHWDGVGCGPHRRCPLTVLNDITATATFERANDTQAPSTPAKLSARAVSAAEIDLSWSASSDNVAVTGYVIHRDGAKLPTVSGTTTTFQDTGLAPSTTYRYTVQAIDAAGNASPQSQPAQATTAANDTQAPSTPAKLSARAVSAAEIDLSWSASSDNVAVTGYVIHRDGAKLPTVSGTTTTFQDTGLAPSTTYRYTVQAIDAAGNASPQSQPAQATTAANDTQAPSTPAKLSARAVSAAEIDLSWSASSDNVAVTGYVIHRDGAKLPTVSGTTTTFQDTGLAPSTTYRYTVQAIDAAGNASPQSQPAQARTGPG